MTIRIKVRSRETYNPPLPKPQILALVSVIFFFVRVGLGGWAADSHSLIPIHVDMYQPFKLVEGKLLRCSANEHTTVKCYENASSRE